MTRLKLIEILIVLVTLTMPVCADLSDMINTGLDVGKAIVEESKEGTHFLKLIMDLRDEDAEVRKAAADSLGTLGDANAVDYLIPVLQDEDPGVRSSVARALGQIGDSKAVDPLIEALNDEEQDVRENALNALLCIGEPAVEPLVDFLTDWDHPYRGDAALLLGTNMFSEPSIDNTRAIDPLIIALEDENSVVRSDAANALSSIGEPAIDPLIEFLKDRDSSNHADAVMALSLIGGPKASDALTGALKDDDEEVRNLAATKLVVIGDFRSVAPLLKSGAFGPIFTGLNERVRLLLN